MLLYVRRSLGREELKMAQCSGMVMFVFLLLFATPSWCFPNWTPSTCTFPGCTGRATIGYYNLSDNVTNGPICNSHDPETLFWQDIGPLRNQTAVKKVPFYDAHLSDQYVYQEIVSRNSTNYQIRLVILKYNGQRNFYLCGQLGRHDDEFGIHLAKPVTLIDVTARVNNTRVVGMSRLPQNKTFNEGETILPFVCSPNDGEPRKHTATLTIRYEGGLIKSSARSNYILHRIPSIRESSGQYECSLANLANTHPLTLTFNIAIYFGPDFSKTPRSIVVHPGEKLSIPCLVASRPELISLTISNPSGAKFNLTTDYLAAPVNTAPWERNVDIFVTDSADFSYRGTYTLEGISDRTGLNITTTFQIVVIILRARQPNVPPAVTVPTNGELPELGARQPNVPPAVTAPTNGELPELGARQPNVPPAVTVATSGELPELKWTASNPDENVTLDEDMNSTVSTTGSPVMVVTPDTEEHTTEKTARSTTESLTIVNLVLIGLSGVLIVVIVGLVSLVISNRRSFNLRPKTGTSSSTSPKTESSWAYGVESPNSAERRLTRTAHRNLTHQNSIQSILSVHELAPSQGN